MQLTIDYLTAELDVLERAREFVADKNGVELVGAIVGDASISPTCPKECDHFHVPPDVEAWLLAALTGDRNRQRREGDTKPTDRPTRTARRG